ncbi:MAG: hypothetical protein ACP5NX_01300 [Candidatus Bilamarchaeaceae archaeon]
MDWTIKAKKALAVVFFLLGIFFLLWAVSIMSNTSGENASNLVSSIGSACCLGVLIAAFVFFVIAVYLWDHAKKDEKKSDAETKQRGVKK